METTGMKCQILFLEKWEKYHQLAELAQIMVNVKGEEYRFIFQQFSV